MIKASVLYPQTPDAEFDFNYYRDTHMPLVKTRMGDACLRYSIDRGVSGGEPGTAPTYVAVGHIYCVSVEAFQAGLGPHMAEIGADLVNFTNLQPEMQISEVILETSS